MRIHPFQAVYPNFEFIASPDSFFGTVKEQYPFYRENNFFKKASQEAIYIYQIKKGNRKYTGIIACSDIQEYNNLKIKKHEETISEKEQQQMQLMLRRQAMVKPVLLTYPDLDNLNQLMNDYIKRRKVYYSTTFELTGEEHKIWGVNDGQLIQEIQTIFAEQIKEVYIADGHHRTSTTALMHDRLGKNPDAGNYNLLLSAFFPASQLDIHDYNRVVEALDDVSAAKFMAKISQVFDIEILEEAVKPSKKFELTMIIGDEWYRLNWKAAVLKKYEKERVVLDANLLNEEVLKNIIGIEDVRTDLRLKYVEGPAGVEGLRAKATKNEKRIGFCLFPVELKDIMMIADAEEIMPPKSTWFEPRIKNGLIVQEF